VHLNLYSLQFIYDGKKNIKPMTEKQHWLADKAQERAEYYYTTAYKRWALELSHDKNEVIAKDIASFVVKELLSYTEDDFWSAVLQLITASSHKTLYNP